MAKIKCVPQSARESLPPEVNLAEYCKALAHPTRVEIVRLLFEKGECISGDLAINVEKAPSTISEHLKILKDANLVMGTIDGPKRCYCANPAALAHMKHLIEQLTFKSDVSRQSRKR